MTGTSFIPLPARNAYAAKAAEKTEAGSSNKTADEASDESGLPVDTEQAEMAKAFGLSAQPRETPSGEVLDETQNPLGGNVVLLNRAYQLAYSIGDHNSPDNLNVYDNPVSITKSKKKDDKKNDKVSFNNPLASGTSGASSFRADYRETVAADTNGDGFQEVVNIGLYNNELKLYVSDFSNTNSYYGKAASSPVYTVDRKVTGIRTIKDHPQNLRNGGKDLRDYTPFSATVIMAAAGDFNHDNYDEIAIGV